MEPKIIIENRILQPDGGGDLQLVAVVYEGMRESRVYAPSRATGDPLAWKDQLTVHINLGYGDLPLREPERSGILNAVFAELKKSEAEAARAQSDALYYNAQICTQGDVQSADGTPFDPMGHCPKCGSKCINKCLHCEAPIRGRVHARALSYQAPSFCHRCGKAYPWMDDKLRTARDLMLHDDKLTYEERRENWDLLQYVMSNPNGELAKAKSTLLMIKIQKAAEPIKEFVTDVLAKYAAEITKG
jgi:hypothetical protein